MDLKTYQPIGKLQNKHMLTLFDYSTEEIYELLSLAIMMKNNKDAYRTVLKNKKLAMIFAKNSTRTRVSFEAGMYELGGYPIVLSSDQTQIGRGETIEDTARVLSRFVDGIMIRTFDQEDLNNLAKWGSVPIINGLTDDYHPCQILADLQTIYEHFGKLKGLKLSYFGDGNNMTHSLAIGCAKVGIDFACACPANHMPNAEIMNKANTVANENGCKITITTDAEKAAKDADVLYTDVWRSMGQEEKDISEFLPYQVNKALFAHANEDAVLLHCLPAHRDEEVTEDIFESKKSLVFDEAENRLHAQKAVMALLMGD